MFERDYPVGHPAASDYHGEAYTPPRAPFAEDFPPDSSARGGKNTSEIDTPDGMRKQTVKEWHANAQRMRAAEPLPDHAEAQPSNVQTAADNVTVSITGQLHTS